MTCLRRPARRWAAALAALAVPVVLAGCAPGSGQAASPSPGAGATVAGIAASSPGGAWAVGQYGAIGPDDALAVRYCARASG
jgi:hypothetical protein